MDDGYGLGRGSMKDNSGQGHGFTEDGPGWGGTGSGPLPAPLPRLTCRDFDEKKPVHARFANSA